MRPDLRFNPILFYSDATKILDWLHSSGPLGQNRNGNNLHTNDCTFKVAEYLIRVLFNNSCFPLLIKRYL